MYHVIAQGADERMINVHYYYITVPASDCQKRHDSARQNTVHGELH